MYTYVVTHYTHSHYGRTEELALHLATDLYEQWSHMLGDNAKTMQEGSRHAGVWVLRAVAVRVCTYIRIYN